MKQHIRYSFLILLLLAAGIASAQPAGYLGKRWVIGAGSSLNYSLFNRPPDPEINDAGENTVFPPKLSLGAEYVLSDRISFRASYLRYAMPNSKYYLSNTSFFGNTLVTETDTFQIRSNMRSIHIELRSYKEYAPYGKYWAFGMGQNTVQSRAFQTVYTFGQPTAQSLRERTVKYPSTSHQTNMINFYIAKGRQDIVKEFFTVDYGFRVHWFLGASQHGNVDLFNNVGREWRHEHREIVEQTVDFVIRNRALETHFIELYLNVGIIK